MEKARPKLTESIAAKIAAFVLLVLCACACIATAAAVIINSQYEPYSSSNENLKQDFFGNFAHSAADDILREYLYDSEEAALKSCEDSNISFAIYDMNGNLLCGTPKGTDSSYVFTTEVDMPATDEARTTFRVDTFVNRQFPKSDEYSVTNKVVDIIYSLRFSGVALSAVFFVLSLILFIFLMYGAGHRAGHEGIAPGPMTKIPLDLFAAGTAGVILLIAAFISELSFSPSVALSYELAALSVVAMVAILMGFFVSFATRVKLKKWWRNTIIYFCLHLIWLIFKKIGQSIGYFFRNLSLVWKTVLFMMAIILFSLITVTVWDDSGRVTLWFFSSIALFGTGFYIAITLKKLQESGRKIAKGDLSYRVDTSRMLWDFKEHGENLNSIGSGLTRAVDERMKSERFKTELITNVSHDIKTPLTSIINYVDLISKEECANEKISEYVEVLSRQSERLKKLIEDLVEASKASTGNIEVMLSPCDVGVMLAQTSGEYETKLADCELELVVTKPEEPVMILADGRLLWRVFDNLLNNICKYAQPGTRVYISLESSGDKAVISFKNVSKYALNISADELMERFVRGDSSRHAEGSGLGLSIAKSLTELQKGEMKLDIDGDLFKAQLKFKSIQ